MSNMDVTQRTQYDRAELGDTRSSRLLRPRSRGAMIAFTLVASLVAIVLCVAVVVTIEGWAQWLVLVAIVLTVFGLSIAISPNRRDVSEGKHEISGS